MRQDLHLHTTWSDGTATPREMIERAIDLGLERIAITDHSFLQPDEGYCLERDMSAYLVELRSLASEYSERIEVLCGIEQDFYSPSLFEKNGANLLREQFDWVVGSVHYVACGEGIFSIDDTVEIFEYAVREYFDGDYLALAECYFETVSRVVERTGASMIGHFDLVKKFNGKNRYFNEEHSRYRAAWQQAADALIETKVPFEINTGGIFKGWRTDPYPSLDIQDYLRARNATLIWVSDAHSMEGLYFGCERKFR